ncbi:hypothetical protein TWF569_009008 [Orbilia oligospora]|uniref:Uncharacterized protein n=1 Tax=Orbilia oligospora TaxID=2813651 RepID=A0A7C8J7S2_ORBOL|nr:hypothetical protein TWF102_008391 [Orbilia oligospora]KAF3096303.1 hypothetical protein TWF103_009876 [Orbilia oligospora]KAF3145445.1 hypothetical protein TWF594_004382 [Orbilia oligospora]KAF3155646.1 hypothetical protein TWF569_009008 [Orbilia oligospora]KAF3190943.1 hypothetical protein TWF225_001909 [Orbilia oligospora]
MAGQQILPANKPNSRAVETYFSKTEFLETILNFTVINLSTHFLDPFRLVNPEYALQRRLQSQRNPLLHGNGSFPRTFRALASPDIKSVGQSLLCLLRPTKYSSGKLSVQANPALYY